MSVAAHLAIDLDDYDRRVRTFIPGYAHLLNAVAAACGTALEGVKRPTILDLGVGTGALASRCLDAVPSAVLSPILVQNRRVRRQGRRPPSADPQAAGR